MAGNLSPQAPQPSPQSSPHPSQQQQQQLTARSGNSVGSRQSHSPTPSNQPLSPVKLPLGLVVRLGLGSAVGSPLPHFSSSSGGSGGGTVIEGITKQDLSDIKRLVNPPPAVVVVLEAVVVLLTGRALPFEEIRWPPSATPIHYPNK